MKKVLHLLPMNKLSGAEKMALLICKNMDEYESVVVTGGPDLARVFEQEEIETYHMNFSIKKLIGTTKKLNLIIQNHKIDIIHAHDNTASLVGYLTKKRYGLDVKVVSHIHSCYPWLKENSLNKTFDKLLRPRYDQNIVCGKVVYDFYLEYAPYMRSSRISILSNAINVTEVKNIDLIKVDKIRENFNIPVNKTIYGFIGRMTEAKGLIPFINKLSQYKNQFKDSIFLLVGNGELEEDIKLLIKTLNLEELFILTGFQQDVYSFYPIIDIFFLPSLYEGLPMVLLEAMAFKRPVVSMNVGSISEVISNNENGIIIFDNDLDSFIQAIIKVKNDKVWAKTLGESGEMIITRKYNMDTYNQKLKKVYLNIG